MAIGDLLAIDETGHQVFTTLIGDLELTALSVHPNTDVEAVRITGPSGGTLPLLLAKRSNGAIVFKVNGDGGVQFYGMDAQPGDSISMGVGGTAIYSDADVLSFFGANGAGQSAAIADATDPASTMANLNTLLAYLRSLGLVAP